MPKRRVLSVCGFLFFVGGGFLFIRPEGDGKMQKTGKGNKAATRCDRVSGDWKRYGKLMVKTTFEKESITRLMICYAERVASLKY